MSKSYSNSSNANAAARSLTKKFRGKLRAMPSIRESPESPRYIPTVAFRGNVVDEAVLPIVLETAVVVPDLVGRHPTHDTGTGKTERARLLMSRPGGATSLELEQTLGWKPHTVRAFASVKNNPSRTAHPWGIRVLVNPLRYVID